MESSRGALAQVARTIIAGAPEEDRTCLAWPLACGPAVADKTRPIRFHHGILFVEVPDEAWKSQLLALLPQYVHSLRELTRQNLDAVNFVVKGRMDDHHQR